MEIIKQKNGWILIKVGEKKGWIRHKELQQILDLIFN